MPKGMYNSGGGMSYGSKGKGNKSMSYGGGGMSYGGGGMKNTVPPKSGGSGQDGFMKMGINPAGCFDSDQAATMVNHGRGGGKTQNSRFPK